ncbi:MAG: cytochrome c [Nitrospinae bacterium]|nr:cytochrome c [Nitrospinota bacterium]
MIEKIVVAILVVNILGFIVLWTRNQNLLYAIFAASLLALFGLTVAKEYAAEWRHYQHEYIEMAIEREKNPETAETLKRTPLKILQVWNNELGITDRCVSCHLGYDNPAFKDAPEPFRYHAAAREHDFNKIGCTICHQGQGHATEKTEAHAHHISHWDFPMLPNNMVQASCPQCHEELFRPGYRLKGAEMITASRDLTEGVNELGVKCTSCHTIRGVGEVLGPDLTEFGDKTGHEFDGTHVMKYVEGEKDKYNWTLQHFKDPAKITPNDPELKLEETVMPNYGLTDEQAHALTVYVFSFRTPKLPAKYLYHNSQQYMKKGGETASFIGDYERQFPNINSLPGGQRLFIKSKCWFCHTIEGKGGKIGPDLTKVGNRYDKDKMLEFWNNPSKMAKHSLGVKFNLDESQMEQIADFLLTLK